MSILSHSVNNVTAKSHKKRQRVEEHEDLLFGFECKAQIVPVPTSDISKIQCHMAEPKRKRAVYNQPIRTKAELCAMSSFSKKINMLPQAKIKNMLEMLDETEKFPAESSTSVTDLQSIEASTLRSLQRYVQQQTTVHKQKKPLQLLNRLQQSLTVLKMKSKNDHADKITQLEKGVAAVKEWQSNQIQDSEFESEPEDDTPPELEAFTLAEKYALLEQIKTLPEPALDKVLQIINRHSTRTVSHGNGWRCHVIDVESLSDCTMQLLNYYVKQATTTAAKTTTTASPTTTTTVTTTAATTTITTTASPTIVASTNPTRNPVVSHTESFKR